MSSELAKGSSETASGGPAPKRMRVSRACEQCRSRKAKCDGGTPSCSPCVTLSQQCTYGAQPRKRGLPPGSVSALERTVKLLQRVLGLLILSVDESELALLNLVQRCGSKLFDDGEDGTKLSSAWKDGIVPEALEALRERGQETAERSPTTAATSETPGDGGRAGSISVDLGLAQEHFQEAIRAISSGSGAPAEGHRSSALEGRGHTRRQQQEEAPREQIDGDRAGGGSGEMGWVKQSQASHGESGQENTMSLRRMGEPLAAPMPLSNIGDSLLTHNIGAQYQNHLPPGAASPPPPATAFPPIDVTDDHLFPDDPALPAPPTFSPAAPVQTFRPISFQSMDSPARDSYHSSHSRDRDEDPVQLPANSRLLLDLYFTYTHVWLPILDKYDLIRLFHVVNSSSSAANRKVHPAKAKVPSGKRALLYAVLSLATIQHEGLPQPSSSEVASSAASLSAATLYTAAQRLVFSPGEDYRLEHVQALLLLSLINTSLSHLSTAWLLIGHAGRVAVDIDLKTAEGSRFNTRTWLGYLVLETFIAGRLGREPCVQEGDWNVSAIEEDGWEEWDSWKEVPTAGKDSGHGNDDPAHILSVFNQLVALSRLVRRVAALPLPAASRRTNHTEDLSAPQTILRQLYSWSRELLPHLSFDILNPRDPAMPTTPHISHLHLYYAHAILTLHHRCPPHSFRDSFNGMSDLAPAAASSTASILEHARSVRSLSVLPCTFRHFATSVPESFPSLTPSVAARLSALTTFLDLRIPGFTSSTSLLKSPPRTPPPSLPLPPPPPPPQRPRMAASEDTFTAQLAAMSPSRLFTFTPPATMLSPAVDHFRRPSAFVPEQSGSVQMHTDDAAEGGRNNYGASGSTASLSVSQTAPSPDGFDEEMGMLECLPWTQNGIPEFMQNLGYIGGFSPSAFQLPHEEQAPLQILGLRQDSVDEGGRYDSGVVGSGGGGEADEGPGGGGRRGMNTVLERWLGDVLGAGGGARW